MTIRLPAAAFITTLSVGRVRAAILADSLCAAGFTATAESVLADARAVRGSWTCATSGATCLPTHERYTEVATMERSLVDWVDENVPREARARAWSCIMGKLLFRYSRGNYARPATAELPWWVAPALRAECAAA